MTSAYVDEALDLFIADHDGREIDVTGTYGAQSPDLISAYVSRLLGRDWIFPYGWAAQLWLDHRGVMAAAGFERIERVAPLQRGDVLVFDNVNSYGTVGIFTAPAVGGMGVYMFTQNPGPAHIIGLEINGVQNRMLGAWRFTAAAECIALTGVYADNLQTKRDHAVIEQMKADEWAAGLAPTCPPGDLAGELRERYGDRYVTTPEQVTTWLKKWDDPSMQPGDVAVWGDSMTPTYGHVERKPFTEWDRKRARAGYLLHVAKRTVKGWFGRSK